MYKIRILSVLDGLFTEKESENLEDFVECFEVFCYDEDNNFSPNNINKHIDYLDIFLLSIDNIYVVIKKFEEKHRINLNKTLFPIKGIYPDGGKLGISVMFYYPGREYEHGYWEDSEGQKYLRDQIRLHYDEIENHPGTFTNLLTSNGLSEEFREEIRNILREANEVYGTFNLQKLSKEEQAPFKEKLLELRTKYEKRVNFVEPEFKTKAWTTEEIKEYKRANRHLFNVVT